MIAWRVCKAQYATAALTGEGTRLYGGRWSPKGLAVVYAAEHLATCVLELLVHLADGPLPPLVRLRLEVPEEGLEVVPAAALPAGWRAPAPPEALQDLGRRLVASGGVGLVLPSAVVPEERNLVLNPAATPIRLVDQAPLDLDPRLLR